MSEPPEWAKPGAQPGRDEPTSTPGQDTGAPDGAPPTPGWGPPPSNLRPGVIPLRPLALGEILDGAISFIRANPMATIGLSAAIIAVVQLVQLPLLILLGGTTVPTTEGLSDPAAFADLVGSTVTSSLIGLFVQFLGLTVLTGMLIVVLSQAVLGRPMTIGEAWRAARGRIPGLLGISLLAALAITMLFVLALVPAFLAYLLDAGVGITFLLLALGGIAALAAAIYLWVTWALIGPIYVLEHAGVLAAFGRSRALVRPQWWRIFGIMLLSTIIATVISGIIGVPFSLAAGGATALSGAAAVLTPTALVLAAIGGVLAGMLTAPFQAGVTGLVYFDQRIRREALDITLQRAAGK